MCANRVGYVLNGDSTEMFVFADSLHEELLVQVVQVVLHKHMNVAHDLQYIHTLAQKNYWIAGVC